ncbi:Glycosyltransferase family 1 protein [Candidatus Magnetomoraceae bacterium gMMP-15]
MKITILYKFRDTSWGGANQFLKALRNYFKQTGCYEDNPELSDVILFISYPFNDERLFTIVKKLKKKKKNIIVVNRMNGPICLYRDKDFELDKINFEFNYKVADGTVYQSEWSRQKCYDLGMRENNYETVIMNAPDPQIFYPLRQHDENINFHKIKLIAVSWSDNPKKGFDIYKYLDSHLDFKRYQMTFVGNSHYKFNNIIQIKPVISIELAKILREHDIFVFGSKIETCSNSLIEALHCGLSVVARNNSSQPEVIGKGGVLFNGINDILSSIDTVADNLQIYKNSIKANHLNNVGKEYYNFCRKIFIHQQQKIYRPKRWGYISWLKIVALSYKWKYFSMVKNKLKQIRKHKVSYE